MLVLVHRVHRQQTQPVADGAFQRDAQVAGGVANHERHQFGRGFLGREDQVTLVLAILVVDDDDGLARCDVGDRPFDGVQFRHRVPPAPDLVAHSMNHAAVAVPSAAFRAWTRVQPARVFRGFAKSLPAVVESV